MTKEANLKQAAVKAAKTTLEKEVKRLQNNMQKGRNEMASLKSRMKALHDQQFTTKREIIHLMDLMRAL